MPPATAPAPAIGPHEPVLFVRDLTKHYARLTALAGVSFSIRRGEVLGVIGPNGSGKTTLFECLGGVLPVDAGAIEGATGRLNADQRTAQVFYLPDSIAPWPSQRVSWLLEYMTGLFGGRAERIPDVARELGLEPLLDAPLGSLSKGQRKRALLAMGLLTPQPVLLADEPFDGLDLRQTREVAASLRATAGAGRAVVLSIHQISDAARVCDRFVLLSHGRVCGEGTFDELTEIAASRSGTRPSDLEQVFLALT
ncbi:MAG: ABC transporter ATP-binding protein [Vicinamibacterales bacterium]